VRGRPGYSGLYPNTLYNGLVTDMVKVLAYPSPGE
jgi:hypothetical protein